MTMRSNMFEQDRMIGRLQRQVNSDAGILACFLSGSFGRRTNDAFSDLDVGLVFADETARAHAWQNRAQFAKSIMPYVSLKSFDAQHIRPNFHIALYANGCKIDFRYETRDGLKPNPWDSQIRILKDSRNWAENFQVASAQLAFPQPGISSARLKELDNRFWIMCWDIVRQLARGDTNRPFTIYLEVLHFTLPTILGLLPPGDPAEEKLSQANYQNNAQKSIESMLVLLDAYVAARASIIQRYSLQYSMDSSFEGEIRRLLEKLL